MDDVAPWRGDDDDDVSISDGDDVKVDDNGKEAPPCPLPFPPVLPLLVLVPPFCPYEYHAHPFPATSFNLLATIDPTSSTLKQEKTSRNKMSTW